MKVLIIDKIHPVLSNMLERSGNECLDMSAHEIEEIQKALSLAEVLVMRSRITMDKQAIDACQNLKIIARAGAGLEHIDLEYAKRQGITVLNSPEGNRQAVGEHALGMLLALFNKLPKADSEVRHGRWLRNENAGIELAGKTVGIIGYGHMGSAFAKLLSGFDVNILAYDKYKSGFENEATTQQIFDQADIVSLHIPLTTDTRYLVCESWINKFRKPIYLINTSRGKIVNTNDFLLAIESEKVMGACLDVLEHESSKMKLLYSEHTAELTRLFACDKVILSPHTAGLTEQSHEKLSKILAEKILKYLAAYR